jgi:oxygen-independent coproporphyrinogen-3 oxidase
MDIRNYFEVDKKSISSQFEIEFDKHFNEEILNLQKYVTDGLVIISEEKILITSKGEQFANLIASTFDTYIVQT